jgi:hypothetical protein
LVELYEDMSCHDRIRSASYEHYFGSNWSGDKNVDLRHRDLTDKVTGWLNDVVNPTLK